MGFAIAALLNERTTAPAAPNSSVVGVWTLIELDGEPVVPGERQLWAAFSLGPNLVAVPAGQEKPPYGVLGDAGCNSFGGGYQVSDDRLLIELGGMSRVGCGEAIDAQEEALVSLLTRAETWSADAGQLVISGGGQRAVFRASDDTHIVGVWTVTNLNGQPPAAASTMASITFALDGTIGGYTGCEALFGTFGTDGEALKVVASPVTKNACSEGTAEVEAGELLVALVAADTWAVSGEQLTLTGADATIVLERGR
jgi:heat shock protein HslJ